ncbi:Reverse transcriptase zinc-binding domain [Macleaya cordata]|uniref:Reverse transcriptase zinc-binding domain n=1 Tax=Macleaya cordata TaxID=56857 RepID=A0A200R2G8_MACCD|nr:Reverse transcriptase zinc-binding domain [Macleaya cordata]
MPSSRKRELVEQLGIMKAEFPDVNLGVNLFPGRVKSIHIWPLVEKFKSKLAGWKGRLLSFQARLTLIKSVLLSFQVYNMAIYKWPKSIIKEVEKMIHNFLWTSDCSKSKMITSAWHKVCRPMNEGGLGIRRLEWINKSLLMKMCWFVMTSQSQGAKFLRAKYTKKRGGWITYHKKFSIWLGLKWVIDIMQSNSNWVLGNGREISLWNDAWCSDRSIINLLNVGSNRMTLSSKVSDIIQNGRWVYPPDFSMILQKIGIDTNSLPIPSEEFDTRVWSLTTYGSFTVASNLDLIRDHFPKVSWSKWVWKTCIHLRLSSQVWKILNGSCATDDIIKKCGVQLASRCFFCECQEEDIDHIIWTCRFSMEIWDWIHNLFHLQRGQDFVEILKKESSHSEAVSQA